MSKCHGLQHAAGGGGDIKGFVRVGCRPTCDVVQEIKKQRCW